MARAVRLPTPIERGGSYELQLAFPAGFIGQDESITASLRQTFTSATGQDFAVTRDGDVFDLSLSGEQTLALPLLPHILDLSLVRADESVDPLDEVPSVRIDVVGQQGGDAVTTSSTIVLSSGGAVEVAVTGATRGAAGSAGADGSDGTDGADGASASQQLYDAAIIDEPTVEAMNDYYSSVAIPLVAAAIVALIGGASNSYDTLKKIQDAIEALSTVVSAKAPLLSPALTGVPTAPTAAPGTNTTQLATTAFTQAAITALVGGAPGALDTLKELADAINDDASYAATITTLLGGKQGLDPTLTALANYNTNGILVQTAADTFAGRSIIAGSAKITVSNGDGASGNPSINLGSVASTDLSDSAALARLAAPTLSGTVTVADATTTAPNFAAQITGDTNARLKMGLDASDNAFISFGPGNATRDSFLVRDGSGLLAQRNGANAQGFRVYNTYTDASNYERAHLSWQINSNWFTISTGAAGTGTARSIVLVSAGGLYALGGTTSSSLAFKLNGSELQIRLADDSGFGDLAARKLALTPSNDTSAISISGSSVTGTGTTPLVSLAQTWNTTGVVTGVFCNFTDTASNSSSKIFDFQVNGVSKVTALKTGILTVQGLTSGSGGVSSTGVVQSTGGTVQSSGVANPLFIAKSSNITGVPGLQLQNSAGTVISKFTVDLNSGDNYIGIAGGSGYFLTFHYNSGTEGMRLTTGGNFGIGCTPTEKLQVAGNITFSVDNTYSLGTAALRSSVVYSGTGTINTSDARAKQDVGSIPAEWLDAWTDVEWQRYRFIDAVEEKGDEARWHLGMVAQEVHAAFAAHGLDAFSIGLCCYDDWEAVAAVEAKDAVLDKDGNIIEPPVEARPGIEAGDRWGLRYSECFAIEAAWQRRELARQDARITALEARP